MSPYLEVLLVFFTPIGVALQNGSSYRFAFGVSVVGVVLYVANVLLIRWYISRRAPRMANDEQWEATAGRGVVPKWVSRLGLYGTALVPSGLVVALLLALDVVILR